MSPIVGQLFSNGGGNSWRVRRVFQLLEPHSRWAVELVANCRTPEGQRRQFILKAPQFRLFCAFGGLRVAHAPEMPSSFAPD